MSNILRKINGFLAASLAGSIAFCAVFTAVNANPLAADVRLHVITDPRSGLALFGYDPVAYHVDHVARLGLPEHQAMLDGRLWIFSSAANKAAFEADTSAYIPLFGGHDGTSVSDGILAKGDPEMFLIASGQLVLFRNEDNRSRFVSDAMLRQKARQGWPDLVRQQAAH